MRPEGLLTVSTSNAVYTSLLLCNVNKTIYYVSSMMYIIINKMKIRKFTWNYIKNEDSTIAATTENILAQRCI